MYTIRTALTEAASRLRNHSDSPMLDSEILLASLLKRDRSYLFAWPERPLAEAETKAFTALVTRRAAGEPVAHLTGRREFWSLDLRVTADTLIPRPETELLVELALERLPRTSGVRLADLGCGSGAVALAIASERPECSVIATDRSVAALAVARENATRLGLDRVAFRHGQWCAPLAGERFAMVVSNPPYVAAGDPHLAEGALRFEPADALVSGPDGLDDIRAIVDCVGTILQPGGWLLLEHGWDQGRAVAALLTGAGLEAVTTHRDLAGQERVCSGRRPTTA